MRRVKIVFCDVRPDTFNIDECKIEALITPQTRAIVIVHYAGVACEMDKILEIGKRRGVAIIEDNAHGLFGTYKGKQLGSFGLFATQSFHETKNITCGEGGALLINDTSYISKVENIRDKGTNRSGFLRGQVDKYTWVSQGSSYVISDILAAFLYAQLENAEVIQCRRRKIWDTYYELLADWAQENAVKLPFVPEYCSHPAHMFYLVFPSIETRSKFIADLKTQNIASVFHYQPLSSSPMGRTFTSSDDFPVSTMAGDCLVRLPMYFSLSDDELLRCCNVVKKFRTRL